MQPLTLFLTALAFSFAVIAGIPSLRQKVRDQILPDHREIVAKIEGQISGQLPNLTILKVKTRDQFFIEIYRLGEDLSLMQRIAIEEPTDGHFEFQGQYTNLALADLDVNGEFEIVCPMYDRNGTPRLLVYKYNPDILTFEKLSPE